MSETGEKVYVVLTSSGDYYTRNLEQAEQMATERNGEIQMFTSLDAALRVYGSLKPIKSKTDEK